MFENLKDKFQNVFSGLGKKGILTEKDIDNCKKIYSKLSEKKFNKLLKKQDDLKLSSNLRSTLQKIRQNGGSYDMIAGSRWYGFLNDRIKSLAKEFEESGFNEKEIRDAVTEIGEEKLKSNMTGTSFTKGTKDEIKDKIINDRIKINY